MDPINLPRSRVAVPATNLEAEEVKVACPKITLVSPIELRTPRCRCAPEQFNDRVPIVINGFHTSLKRHRAACFKRAIPFGFCRAASAPPIRSGFAAPLAISHVGSWSHSANRVIDMRNFVINRIIAAQR